MSGRSTHPPCGQADIVAKINVNRPRPTTAWVPGGALRARPCTRAEVVIIFVWARGISANSATISAWLHGGCAFPLLISMLIFLVFVEFCRKLGQKLGSRDLRGLGTAREGSFTPRPRGPCKWFPWGEAPLSISREKSKAVPLAGRATVKGQTTTQFGWSLRQICVQKHNAGDAQDWPRRCAPQVNSVRRRCRVFAHSFDIVSAYVFCKIIQ